VVSIVVVIAAVGFLEGVAIGLALSFLRFLVTYSRTEVVRTRRRGSATPSRVDRPAQDQALLGTVADRIVVLELQGFVFFGTGHQLAEEVRSSLLTEPDTRHVVLDLQRVTGADSTARQSLQRIARQVAEAGATLVLVGPADGHSRALGLASFVEQDGVRVVDDLDRGVQWCEEQLLAEARPPEVAADSSLRADLEAELGDQDLIDRLLAVVEHLQVPAGTQIIRRGDLDHDLYLLEDGQLTVSLPGDDDRPVRVRTMTAGTVIGEIGLELGVPRSADVVADTDVRLLRLPATTLERLAVEDPRLAAAVHRYLARLLARRLVTSLRTIEALERGRH
jgi:SulP family sulfate permease